MISLNIFELNGSSQCDGCGRDIFQSQFVRLMCLEVVDRGVDDVLGVVSEVHGDCDH